MAKKARKSMSKEMDMEDEDDETDESEDDSDSEKSPKRRVKKITVEETFAKGGAVRSGGCVMAGRGTSFRGIK